jgi:hypothetical protein
MARPKIELTEEQIAHIEKLAPVLTQEQLADFLGISDRTFRNKMWEDERVYAAYKRGRGDAVANVGKNLIQQALDGNTTAAIFFLKTQAGWREKQELEVSGPGGGAIATEIKVVHEVIDNDSA